ncbi:MAG: peptide MFS transporter [Bryobacteraceae bacterium]|nr:peptide MFS transporter [Bryobacteraceae bacterium]
MIGFVTSSDRSFFGHPRGLATLFFTEMWERFSYYGMRAILILYLTSKVDVGGLNLDVVTAGAIYGIFTSCAYLTGMSGGWVADRFLGQRKGVLLGGALIAAGNFGMMVRGLAATVIALTLIAFGTGFLKTNCTTMVGALYREGDVRRDAGFSIYYMGINIGAMVAPLICGYLGQTIHYRWAFLCAGLFMLAGLLQFSLTSRHLGDSGLKPHVPPTKQDWGILQWAGIGLAVVIAGIAVLRPSIAAFADAFGLILLLTAITTFTGLIFFGGFSTAEKRRIQLIFVLFCASTLFWSSFEQAGSTLNLFADRSTDNRFLGLAFPSSFYQALNSLFLLFMAPGFAWLWVKLGDRDPSLPTKFSWGLLGVAAGFVVMALAATAAGPTGKVGPEWLTLCYFLHSAGELCLSPVGLSAMTKLAPARIGGFMMGVWFLSIAMGNFIGGRVSSFYEAFPLPQLFGLVAAFGAVFGLILLVIAKPVARLMTADKE